MSKYIDADVLAEQAMREATPDRAALLLRLIDNQHTADIRENVKGEWVKTNRSVCGDNEYHCSNCGETFWNGSMSRYNFCPKCGADMRGVKHEEI